MSSLEFQYVIWDTYLIPVPNQYQPYPADYDTSGRENVDRGETAPTFEYETGPDGKRYIVGGEVGIDTSVVPDDPEATIKKAQVVQRAALAPADPSPQDYKVAAEARQMGFKARQELARQQAGETTSPYNGNGQAIAFTPPANLLDFSI